MSVFGMLFDEKGGSMATRAILSGEFRSIQQELQTLSAMTVTNQNKDQVGKTLLNLRDRLTDFTSYGSGIGSVEILQCKQELDRINDTFLRILFEGFAQEPNSTSYAAPPHRTLPRLSKSWI